MSEIKTKIDSLGRVVIPVKIRKKLGIELNSEIHMTLDENKVHISAVKKKCIICNNKNDLIDEFSICKDCIDKIVAFSKMK